MFYINNSTIELPQKLTCGNCLSQDLKLIVSGDEAELSCKNCNEKTYFLVSILTSNIEIINT